MDWFRFDMMCMLGVCVAGLQGILSDKDGYLTRAQMRERHGIDEGYSFIQHGGMWYDMFVITPLVAGIVGRGSIFYLSHASGISFAITLVLWLFLGWYFRSIWPPEAHAHYSSITSAGVVHLGFAILVTWLILSFYSGNPPRIDLIVVSCVLTPLFFFGVFKFDRKWRWNPGAIGTTVGGPVLTWAWVIWRLTHQS